MSALAPYSPLFSLRPVGAELALSSIARRAEARRTQKERLLTLTAWVRDSAGWWADALGEALEAERFAREDRSPTDPACQELPRWRGANARGSLWLELQARCWREYGSSTLYSGLALDLSASKSPAPNGGPVATPGVCLGVAFIYRCPLEEAPDERSMQESLLQLEPEQVLDWLRRHVAG